MSFVEPLGTGSAEFRIISINAGMGIRDRGDKQLVCSSSLAFDALATVLLSQTRSQTVVALQEVDFRKGRSGYRNYATRLQDILNDQPSAGPETWHRYYFDPTHPGDQQYGLALVTNIPVQIERKWDLDGQGSSDERRGALALRLVLKSDSSSDQLLLWFVNTHLSTDQRRVSQAHSLVQRIGQLEPDIPVVLAGDLNVFDVDYPMGPTAEERDNYGNVYAASIGALTGADFGGTRLRKVQIEPSIGPSDYPGVPTSHTFHAWQRGTPGRPAGPFWGVLDYLLLLNRGSGVRAVDNRCRRIFPGPQDGEVYYSDHLGLAADLVVGERTQGRFTDG